MKIKYEFVNGEVSEVEVDESVGTFILQSRRREDSDSRLARKYTYSLDAILYEGSEYGREDVYPCEEAVETERLSRALEELTDVQRRRLIWFAKGMSYHAIAEKEQVNVKTVFESIEAGRKKIKKYL